MMGSWTSSSIIRRGDVRRSPAGRDEKAIKEHNRSRGSLGRIHVKEEGVFKVKMGCRGHRICNKIHASIPYPIGSCTQVLDYVAV